MTNTNMNKEAAGPIVKALLPRLVKAMQMSRRANPSAKVWRKGTRSRLLEAATRDIGSDLWKGTKGVYNNSGKVVGTGVVGLTGAGLANMAFGSRDKTPSERFAQPGAWLLGGFLSGAGNTLAGSAKAIAGQLNKPTGGPIATTEFSGKGLANTLNPISGILGGTDYVPAGWMKTFGQGNENLAHATFKTGAIGLLAAGLIGGYRALLHANEMKDLSEADRPGRGLSSQLSTTFSGNIDGKKRKKQQKTAAEQPMEVHPTSNFSMDTFMQSALPAGALLLAGALAYRGVDAVMDRRRNKQLDKAIAAKENAIKNLIATRARVAKGNADMEEIDAALRPINRDSIYVKEAAQNKEAGTDFVNRGVQTAGLMASAIVLASAIGAYAYTAAGDENNLKYKAYKRALAEYAKSKSGITPITVIPTDSKSYFSTIDAGKKSAKSPRNMPAVDTDAINKPISISI